MRKSTATVRDLIDELITPDEQRPWNAWWTQHPADLAETNAFTDAQSVLFSEMQRLADQGAADSMTPALIVMSGGMGFR